MIHEESVALDDFLNIIMAMTEQDIEDMIQKAELLQDQYLEGNEEEEKTK